MTESTYWLGFSAFPGVGPQKFKLLLDGFKSAKIAWNANKKELIAKYIGQSLTIKFVQFRKEFDLEKYENKLKKLEITPLFLFEEQYPKLLKSIPNPPFVLYVRGKTEILKQVQDDSAGMFGIVGTRKITNYGTEVTKMFAGELARAGFTIVSGLALGVDAVAHQSAVQNFGKTIAVLGCGVDCCTPSSNQSIYNSIVKGNGCVISEVPPGYLPTKGSFPSRNRIIAELSKAVLVPEGAEDSGSLITADYAFKFNRQVFAIPGPVTSSLSKGPYKLVRQGAIMITDPVEILTKFQISNDKFQINTNKNLKFKTGTKEERRILELLENEAVHFNDLVQLTKMTPKKVGSLLSLMEVKGMVKSRDGGRYSIVQ